jgi:CheY-like chemotaxis protein
MEKERVLVVDDEELNLLIIEEFLELEEVSLEMHSDPQAAWARLMAPESDFSLVILDRMMPELDGMEFLRRMKREARFADIPVIMQTAASSPDQVREGLAAGAYYYLTKPYAPEALTSIVRVALDDRRARSQLRSRAAHLEEAQKLMRSAEYRFVTLDDVASLVPVLAALCPAPDVVAPGLSDLMVNAVEHGNLGVSYQEKSLLKWEGDWEAEIARRLALPQFRERFATIRLERTPVAVVFTISDQGQGFAWDKFLTFDPERAFDPNGRGIAMARMMSFSSLEYQGCGNVVVATVNT